MTNRILIAFITTAFAFAFTGLGTTTTSGCASNENIHLTPEAQGQPCTKCHLSAYAAASNPVHTNVVPDTCNDCHDQLQWSPIDNFHAFDDVKKIQCYSCHKKDYDNTTSPNHAKAGYPHTCEGCHKAGTSWTSGTGG